MQNISRYITVLEIDSSLFKWGVLKKLHGVTVTSRYYEMEEIPNNHLGCRKTGNGIPTSTGAGFFSSTSSSSSSSSFLIFQMTYWNGMHHVILVDLPKFRSCSGWTATSHWIDHTAVNRETLHHQCKRHTQSAHDLARKKVLEHLRPWFRTFSTKAQQW